MKDTANSYDIIQNHNQQQQQQQHSWNSRHHQPIANTTSVYVNHHQVVSQSQNAINPLSQRAVGQQNHQASVAALAGQFHQLQSATHHNTAAYYPHLYPTYQAHAHAEQQHLQASSSDLLQHDHHSISSVTQTGVVGAASGGGQVHHQQASNAQNPNSLNHWNTGLGHQPHHAVVTDPTLAYMTAYQNHNTTVADHHRNSSGPMSTSINSSGGHGPTSTYPIDQIYNSAVASASAVAGYGYNLHNTAFFRTSNDVPHTQTGHHSTADISSFWNHGQAGQQTQNHSQTMSNQAAIHRQQMPSGDHQASNYLHDPRMYYNRPAFNNQSMQNFGHTQLQSNQQQDVPHHKMSNLNQYQPQIQHDRSQQTSSQIQASNDSHQKTESNNHMQNSIVNQHLQHQHQHQSDVANSPPPIQASAAKQSIKPPPNIYNKQIATDSMSQPFKPDIKPPARISDQRSTASSQSNTIKRAADVEVDSSINPNRDAQSSGTRNLNRLQRSPPNQQIQKPILNQSNSRNDPRKPINSNGQNRPVYKPAQGDNVPQNRSSNQPGTQNIDVRRAPNPGLNQSKRTNSFNQSSQEDSKQITESTSMNSSSNSGDKPVTDAMASLSLDTNPASKKTTWASIASQPAKISQPKSLKSKMAASNSVLSSAKHLAAVSLESSELKNGINPAIKTSAVAATSIQRSALILTQNPRLSAIASACKMDFGESIETSKISWPAVNAANLVLEASNKETKENENAIASNSAGNNQLLDDRPRREDIRGRDSRDQREYNSYKDHGYNQPPPHRMGHSYQNNNRDSWDNRRDRDIRTRRDSERKEGDDRGLLDDHRGGEMPRREHKNVARPNHYNGSDQYRDRERDYGRRGNGARDRDAGFMRAGPPNSRYEPRHEQHGQHNQNSRGNDSGPVPPPSQLSKESLNSFKPLQKEMKTRQVVDSSNFNPKTFNLEPEDARYFIIKSYSEDDIHKSIKYSIWCSTNHGNKRLDEAYQQQQQLKNGPLYLFFSVNGSGRFCGMAQMTSAVDFDSSSGVWAQSKWQGEFSVKWIFVKDVPNNALRHITLENNEDKPVTNSRDTQEVLSEKGKAVLKILHQFHHTTSIFDDFVHYEKKFDEEKNKKSSLPHQEPHQQHQHDSASRPQQEERRHNRPYSNMRPHNDSVGRDRPRFIS